MHIQRHLHATSLGAALLLGALVASPPADARAKGQVGQRAPDFRLQTIAGNWVSLAKQRGRKVVMVVGMSKKSAPRCKRWMAKLVKRYPPRKSPVEVYQVVVVDKSWYIPRSLVISKLKTFIGPSYYNRFLIEWYTGYAKRYGIPKSTLPVVLVVDEAGGAVWREVDWE